MYSPTLSLNWLNELKLISSSLTIIMRANSVIPMTFFWHSPCWFPLSRPGCRPAAAMYVLPMVLIFSMFENSGFDRSCQKKNYGNTYLVFFSSKKKFNFFKPIYTVLSFKFILFLWMILESFLVNPAPKLKHIYITVARNFSEENNLLISLSWFFKWIITHPC